MSLISTEFSILQTTKELPSIMRPGREHIVFTLENSIAVGSHFLSGVNLGRSMISGLREHFWGKFGTNAVHLGSETVLNRIMGYYHHMLVTQALPGEL